MTTPQSKSRTRKVEAGELINVSLYLSPEEYERWTAYRSEYGSNRAALMSLVKKWERENGR